MEEVDAGTAMELPVLKAELGNQEIEQAVVIRQEEFAELHKRDDKIEEELKDKKVGKMFYTEDCVYIIEMFSVFCCCLCKFSISLHQRYRLIFLCAYVTCCLK